MTPRSGSASRPRGHSSSARTASEIMTRPTAPKWRISLLASFAAVLLVCGGGLYFLTRDRGGGSGASPADPASVAQRFAAVQQRAMSSNYEEFDIAGVKQIVCGTD